MTNNSHINSNGTFSYIILQFETINPSATPPSNNRLSSIAWTSMIEIIFVFPRANQRIPYTGYIHSTDNRTNGTLQPSIQGRKETLKKVYTLLTPDKLQFKQTNLKIYYQGTRSNSYSIPRPN